MVTVSCSWVHLVHDLTEGWVLGAFFCRVNSFTQGTVRFLSTHIPYSLFPIYSHIRQSAYYLLTYRTVSFLSIHIPYSPLPIYSRVTVSFLSIHIHTVCFLPIYTLGSRLLIYSHSLICCWAGCMITWHHMTIHYTLFSTIDLHLVSFSLKASLHQTSASTLQQLLNDASNSVVIKINGDV